MPIVSALIRLDNVGLTSMANKEVGRISHWYMFYFQRIILEIYT